MKAWDIASASNRNFSMFQQLLRAQGVKKYGLALLSGPKQVREILDAFPERCAGLILRRDQDVFDRIVPETVRRYHLAPRLFRDLDIYGTDQPILLVRVGQFPLWNPEHWPEGCTLFLPFQDPANVGAMIRSAAAFGVSRVIMLKESAHPFHHKASRVAGSTLFRVPIFEGPSIKMLRRVTMPLFTLSPGGEDVAGFTFPPTFGLVPGLEGPGVPAELRRLPSLAVPMKAGVESLNAALATGIVLYLWRSRVAGETYESPLDKAAGRGVRRLQRRE
ncbi:MAG: RNA methyltransferase [Thermodesulfobacteriota bacterium]